MLTVNMGHDGMTVSMRSLIPRNNEFATIDI
jgi:hypothetical protein